MTTTGDSRSHLAGDAYEQNPRKDVPTVEAKSINYEKRVTWAEDDGGREEGLDVTGRIGFRVAPIIYDRIANPDSIGRDVPPNEV